MQCPPQDHALHTCPSAGGAIWESCGSIRRKSLSGGSGSVEVSLEVPPNTCDRPPRILARLPYLPCRALMDFTPSNCKPQQTLPPSTGNTNKGSSCVSALPAHSRLLLRSGMPAPLSVDATTSQHPSLSAGCTPSSTSLWHCKYFWHTLELSFFPTG